MEVKDAADASFASHTLTGGEVSSLDSKILTFTLSFEDMNDIKKLSTLAVSRESTFIVMTSKAATDMASNPLVEIPSSKAQICGTYTLDETDPTLLDFSLNMDTGVLTLDFSETVKVGSFKPTEIRIQDSEDGDPTRCDCITCEKTHFVKSACTDTVDTLCQECTTCVQGQFASSACGTNADTVCEACGGCTDAGTFVQSLCAGESQTVCGNCAANCKVCGGTGDLCLECSTGSLDNGKCVLNCPTGHYSDSGSCVPCDSSCEECTDSGADQCTSCLGNAVLKNGKCESPCDGLQKFRDTSDGKQVSIEASVTFKGNPPSAYINSFESTFKDQFINNMEVVLTAELEARKDQITRVGTSFDTTPTVGATAAANDADELVITYGIVVDQGFYEDIESIMATVVGSPWLFGESADDDRSPVLAAAQSASFNVGKINNFDFASQTDQTVGDVQIGSMCTDCDTSCGSCFGAEENQCTECANDDVMKDRNMCVGSCPAGTYASSGSCLACAAGCNDCTDGSTCKADSCAGSLVLENGQCLFAATTYGPSTPPSPPPPAQETPRLQNCDSQYDTVHVFTGAVNPTTEDGLTIEMTLTETDQNAIKATDKVAKDKDSTWIAFSDGTIADMSNAKIVAVGFDAAKQTKAHTPDATAPQLTGSTFDVEGRELTLVFSEPVRANTLSVADIAILNDGCLVCTTDTYRHDGGCISTCPAGYYAFAGDSESGAQCKKCHSTCATCSDGKADSCTECKPSLSLAAGVCSFDCASGTFRSDADDRYATVTTTIAFIDVVFNNGFLQADWDLFDERVVANVEFELDENSVMDISSSLEEGNEVAITMRVSQDKYETVVSILDTITAPGAESKSGPLIDDLINNHDKFSFATSEVVVSAAVDLGNMCVACDGTCTECVGADSTDCTECGTDKFLHDSQCHAECPAGSGFDEALGECVTCASTNHCFDCKESLVSYSLTSASTKTTTDNGLTMKVTLGKDDVDAITATTTLGTAQADTYIGVSAPTVDDMAGVNCAQQAELVGTYIEDEVLPELVSFRIDMNKEEIALTFSETVDGAKLKPTFITVRSQAADNGVQEYTLKGGSVTTDPAESTKIVLKLDSSPDLDAIKADTSLATDAEDTFIKLAQGAIVDMNDNAIAEVVSEKATGYVVDSTKPTLTSFDLDMDSLKLKLTFSETVLASSLVPTKITLQHAATVSDTTQVR
jgi:hypothetical protein